MVIPPFVKSNKSFKLFAASPLILADESPARIPNEGDDCAKTIVEKAREQMSKIFLLIEMGTCFSVVLIYGRKILF